MGSSSPNSRGENKRHVRNHYLEDLRDESDASKPARLGEEVSDLSDLCSYKMFSKCKYTTTNLS